MLSDKEALRAEIQANTHKHTSVSKNRKGTASESPGSHQKPLRSPHSHPPAVGVGLYISFC